MRVLVVEAIAPEGLAYLREHGVDVDELAKPSPAELRARLPDYEGLITRSGTAVTAELLDHAPRLRIVGRAAEPSRPLRRRRRGRGGWRPGGRGRGGGGGGGARRGGGAGPPRRRAPRGGRRRSGAGAAGSAGGGKSEGRGAGPPCARKI